jgi:hypothetical protein
LDIGIADKMVTSASGLPRFELQLYFMLNCVQF